jgi:uncharacterized membrane protein
MSRELLGAVFRDEVEAGQAVRSLHYWNRKRRGRLGVMCVVVRKASGRGRYRPFRVMRARRGARWGLLVGALAVGLLGTGAAAASGSFLDTVASRIGTASHWVGYGGALDARSLLRQASGFPYGQPVVIGFGGAVLGGLAGAIVGGILGAIAHTIKGFRRSIRREVISELAPGLAAVLTWAREPAVGPARAELERLGGDPPPNDPYPYPRSAASAAPAPTDSSEPRPEGAGARSWVPPQS